MKLLTYFDFFNIEKPSSTRILMAWPGSTIFSLDSVTFSITHSVVTMTENCIEVVNCYYMKLAILYSNTAKNSNNVLARLNDSRKNNLVQFNWWKVLIINLSYYVVFVKIIFYIQVNFMKILIILMNLIK